MVSLNERELEGLMMKNYIWGSQMSQPQNAEKSQRTWTPIQKESSGITASGWRILEPRENQPVHKGNEHESKVMKMVK